MSQHQPIRRSALLSFRFLGTALVGSVLTGVVAALGPLTAQVAVLGCFVSILAGLFLAFWRQDEDHAHRQSTALDHLEIPLTLAADSELFRHYHTLGAGLRQLVGRPENLLRETALLKLASVAEQVTDLARGRVVFAFTEAWRTAYDRLLTAPTLRVYRSVAWVRTANYWQDEPGQQSMRCNFTAAHRGVRIERIVILHDSLWPGGEILPVPTLLAWLEQQNNQGLWLLLVRESELRAEPDLLLDFGIYGDEAVGLHELDDQARTLRFTVDLDAEAVRLAHQRWERLHLYARTLQSALDQSEAGR